MEIIDIYGFDNLKTLDGEYTDFDTIEDVPFNPLSLNYGDSHFNFVTANGRTWLRSKPKTYSRRAYSYSRCLSTRDVGRYNVCERRVRRHDSGPTNDNRRRDSSLRTPTMSLSIPLSFKEAFHDDSVRYLTTGFSLWLPEGPEHLNDILAITDNEQSAIDGHHIVNGSDIPGDTNTEYRGFVEIAIDKQTGLVRRWVDDIELRPKQTPVYFWDGSREPFFRIGEKSTTTAGENHPTLYTYDYYDRSYSYRYRWRSARSIPHQNLSTTAGAPTNLEYGITDLYFACTTEVDLETTGELRLGPIEVRNTPVNEFFLNRHWLPPSEPPKETVNRIKLTDNVPAHAVVGDTHSDPATVSFERPTIDVGEEVLYTRIKIHAHRKSDGAQRINVETNYNGNKETRSNVLPTNQLSTDDDITTVFAKGKRPGDKSINPGDIELKIKFE